MIILTIGLRNVLWNYLITIKYNSTFNIQNNNNRRRRLLDERRVLHQDILAAFGDCKRNIG